VLGSVDKARQNRKHGILGVIYHSKIVVDLLKARELRVELDVLFQDLQSFKAEAIPDEPLSRWV
jgi:hypothetical protein